MGPIGCVPAEQDQRNHKSFIGASLDAAKRKLAEAEALEAAADSPLPHKLHPSSFVRMGLEIEDQQFVVRLESHGPSLTRLI